MKTTLANEVEITITGRDLSGPAAASALRHIAAIRVAAAGIKRDLGSLSMPPLNIGAMQSSLTMLRSKIQSLGIADIADVNVPLGRLSVQMQVLKRLITQAGIADLLDVGVNTDQITTALQQIQQDTVSIPVNWDVSRLTLPSMPVGPHEAITIQARMLGVDEATKALGTLDEELQKKPKDAGDAETAVGGLSRALLIVSNVWGVVTRSLRTGGGGWGFLIGGVAAWHLALDGVIEAIISVGLAAAAAAVGASVMAETASNLATNFSSVRTTAAALGVTVPPLTGKLDAMAKAMAPQTIEIYGSALNIVASHSGQLLHAAAPVVTLFDDWAAKIGIWANNQGNLNKFIVTGTGYLSQFGHIVGTVGQALGQLLTKDPGIAHYLLDIVGGAASLLKVFTSLPAPIVAGVLALHGLYIWGRPLAAMFIGLGRAAWGWLVTARAMAANPFWWAAAAAAALAYLVYESTQADKSTKKFIANLNSGLGNLSAEQAINQIAVDMGKVSTRIDSMNISTIAKGWGSSWVAAGYDAQAFGRDVGGIFTSLFHGDVIGSITNLGKAVAGIFIPGQGQSIALSNDIAALNNEMRGLQGQQANLFRETGRLMGQGYSYVQAVTLMNMAGVRAGDTYTLMRAKVWNLISGYKSLSISGNILQNSVNAVTFASLQQQEKVQQLNQGWDAFEQTIQGGISNFDAFATSLATADSAFKKAHGNISGLGAASITANTDFVQAAAGANTEMDSITTLANAAGLGHKGTELLAQATKDLVAGLLPAAKHSATLTTVLYALAQRGGYQGANSFRALSSWVGKTQDPMRNLQGIVKTLTVAAGGLTQDVRNLSMALGTTLNNAMATAAFDATGGQKTMDAFAKAIVNTGTNSITTQKAANNLAIQLFELTHNTTDAKNTFISFAEDALGLTKKQAEVLWQNTLPSLQRAINSLHGKHVDISASASGSGTLTMHEQLLGQNAQGFLEFHRAGGPVGGSQWGGGDSIMMMGEPGEWVLTKEQARSLGYGWLSRLPKFASGGLVTDRPSQIGDWMAGQAASFDERAIRVTAKMALLAGERALRQELHAKERSLSRYGAAGPGGGDPAANAALARRMYPQWSMEPYWGAWNYVAMAESGWNQYAMNPGSGAYGIPQALPFTKMPRAAWPASAGGSSNPAAQISWMAGYMSGTYGGPVGAAQHEAAFHWYDGGNWIKPGANYMWNGTGAYEHLVPERSRHSRATDAFEVIPGGNGLFEQFMAQFLRKYVRRAGGGNVQTAITGYRHA